jgi:hypothetical protein
MSKLAIFLTIISLTSIVKGQTVWTKLKTPASNVIGQLLVNGGLNNVGVPIGQVITYEGASELTLGSFRDWSVILTTALSSSKTKFITARYKNIKIDALKDKSIFSESKYYENYFVYRAKRADSVYFSYAKNFGGAIKPTDLLTDSLQIISKLKSNFPNLDSLQVVFNSKDSITYLIANPNVYYEIEVIQFKANNSFILKKDKFKHKEFLIYSNDNQTGDLLKAGTASKEGAKFTVNIDFKGGIAFELFTIDTILSSLNKSDTTFRLGIDVSQTYRNECYYNPMPYKFNFDKTSIRTKKYTVNDNILLTTSNDNLFLAVYLTLNGIQQQDGVLLSRRLSNSFFANRLDYIILKFKRYNRLII